MSQKKTGVGRRDAGTVILHLVTGACLLFAVGLIVNNIHPTRRRIEEMRDQRARLEEEIRRKRAEIQHLSFFADALQNDRYAVERELRKTFRLTRKDENIIRVEGEDAE